MEAKTADMPPASENKTLQELQQEIAALGAELQALRSTTKLQAPHSISRAGHEQAFEFLKLPRELRNHVYELCVVVDEVRIGDADWAQYPDMRYYYLKRARAEFSLLAVNKQIRLGALEVYLSKNHFVVPNASMWSSDSSSVEQSLVPGCPELFLVHKHLSSLSISFDFRSVTDESIGQKSIDFHTGVDTGHEVDSVMDRHDELVYMLSHNFIKALVGILSDHQQLRRLQINLQNATCHLQCHRMVVFTFEGYHVREKLESWVSGTTANRIEFLEFLGTVNEEERCSIRSAFPQSLRSKVKFRGRFDHDLWEWDPESEVFDEPPSEHDALGSSLD